MLKITSHIGLQAYLSCIMQQITKLTVTYIDEWPTFKIWYNLYQDSELLRHGLMPYVVAMYMCAVNASLRIASHTTPLHTIATQLLIFT